MLADAAQVFTHAVLVNTGKVVDRIEQKAEARRGQGEMDKESFSPALFVSPSDQELTDLDFQSLCKAIHHRLNLIVDYYGDGVISKSDLSDTYQLFLQKEVLISVFGLHNCGKSTLINALIGENYLPVNALSETSFKVIIFNDDRIHRSPCKHEASSSSSSDLPASPEFRETPDCHCTRPKHHCLRKKLCPYLREILNQAVLRTTYGQEEINKRLKELNKIVRKKMQDVQGIEFQLFVCVPALSGAPQGWTVCLVDNPGFGEAKQHVLQLAERSMRCSSAYIYLSETTSLGGTVDARAYRTIADQDRESYTDGRFLAVITKFDTNYGYSLSGSNVSEDEALSVIYESIAVATAVDQQPQISLSEEIALPVCGEWAFLAVQLYNSKDADNERSKLLLDKAVKALEICPHKSEQCSEERLKRNVSKAAEMLYVASGIERLQKRIQHMTRSSVKLWGRKVCADYSTKLTKMSQYLSEKRVKENAKLESNIEEYKKWNNAFNFVRTHLKDLHCSTEPSTSEVYRAINQAFPQDIETSQVAVTGKARAKELVHEFEDDTKKKICDKGLHFGYEEFQESMRTFLQKAAAELEKTFNAVCGFNEVHTVLMKYFTKVGMISQSIGERAAFLCSLPKPSLERDVKLTGAGLALQAPNLGQVKEIVQLPVLKFTLFERLAIFVKRLMKGFDQSEAEEPSESAVVYKRWTVQHDEAMRQLVIVLQEQCEKYFEDIRPHAQKHFFTVYKNYATQELEILETGFRQPLIKVDQQLKQTRRRYQQKHEELNQLEKLIPHLADLKTHLNEKILH